MNQRSDTVSTPGGEAAPVGTGRAPLRWSSLSRSNLFWITIVLVLEVTVLSVLLPSGTFLTVFNLQNVAADTGVLLILAAAATLVIVTSGIDLSIGSVLTLSAVVSGRVAQEVLVDAGVVSAAAGIGVAVMVGALCGAVNGLLIAYAKLPPFVVTLGALGATLGMARLLTGGVGVSGAPEAVAAIGQGHVLGIPNPFLIGVLVVVVFSLVLEATRFGEYTYFIGSNVQAAERGGVNVRRHLLAIYLISGGLAGLAGFVDFSRFEFASVTTGHTSELLAALAAVVIGGASLFGGSGTIRGSAIGVFIPVILANGLLIAGVERFWQDIIVGVILIAAVAFDQWRRKSRPR